MTDVSKLAGSIDSSGEEKWVECTFCIHASPRRKMGFFNGHWIGGEERHNSPAAHLVAVSDSFVRCCPLGNIHVGFGVPKTSIQWIHSHWALDTTDSLLTMQGVRSALNCF